MGKSLKLHKAFMKATSPSLRTDNWGYIMDVVDLIRDGEGFGADSDDGVYEDEYDFYSDHLGFHDDSNNNSIMSLISKNLVQENANVILRTLTIMIALSENCGSKIKVALSSKNFTNKVLYEKLIKNNDVHITIRKETAKTIKKLSENFADDPSLKNMADLYKQTRQKHPYLIEGRADDSKKPSVPKKSGNEGNKVRDDYDEAKMLEEALKLSLKEYENNNSNSNKQQEPSVNGSENRNTNVLYQSQQVNSNQTQGNAPHQQQQQQQQPPPPPAVNKVRAMYDLKSNEADELSFAKGDIIRVIEPVYKDWWRGSLNGKIGIFPVNYVIAVPEKTDQEKLQEQQEEQQIISKKEDINMLQNILTKNKDQASGAILQDEQVSKLYGEITPLRPGLSKMLGKYSTKREELLRLNKVLSDSEHLYNSILNQATNVYTQPPQNQQQSMPNQVQNPQAQTSSFSSPYPAYSMNGNEPPYPITPQTTQNLPNQQAYAPSYQTSASSRYYQPPPRN